MTENAAQKRFSVVYLDHVARLSGGEIALLRLLPALGDSVDAHVLLGEDGPLVEALRGQGVSVEVLAMDERLRDTRRSEVATGLPGLTRVSSLVRYVLALRRRLLELQPDLVHTNSLKAALYGGLAARLAGVPVVWHIRDRIADDYLPAAAVRLVRAASRVLPSSIVTNSQSTLGTLPRRAHASVLYNPVVPDIAPEPSPRRSYDTDGVLRIGVIGRLAEWKGQHVFLDAFARAFPQRQAEAWIIGSAMFGEEEYEARIREQAETLGIADCVVWRGFQPDVAGELDSLDILVHCSVTPEPFGQVVVEGMAAGLPVIASAAGGPLEIITPEHDGMLVPPDDADALADAMCLLAGDSALRRRLGEAARESSRRFSPAAASVRLMSVYANVLGGQRSRRPAVTGA